MNMQGTYTDIVEIGSGGGGTVFRAYHVRMQKYVVLKKIHDSIQNHIDIRSELDILKNLRHSYLPTVLDFFEENGSVYTVMDYIPGESFESMLQRGVRFPQAKVIKYAAQLGEVLTYLQEQSVPIIHGDIKPANLMLTPEDNICLIDFNISTMQNGTSFQNLGYTAGYASPEQVSLVQTMQHGMSGTQGTAGVRNLHPGTVLLNPQQGVQGAGTPGTVLLNPQQGVQGAGVQGTVLLNPQPPVLNRKLDERSDLYSVGATLYAMLTGIPPYEDFQKIIPIEHLVADCSEGLIHLIHRCMEYNPNRRYANAREYSKAVASIAKVDKRYKRLVLRQDLTVVICLVGIAASVILSIFGWERIQAEKLGAYHQLVAQMEELQGSEETAKLERLFEEAVSSFPERAEAYYQKAVFLYRARQYDEMIRFLSEDVFSSFSEYTDEETGSFYFLLANGYLEKDMLSEAIGYYKTAVRYQPYDSTYYSDYAIALARNGELDEAEKVLEEAEDLGLSNDRLLLAEGEIRGRRGQTEEAAACFSQCIALTEDGYIKLRAYVVWGRLYDTEVPDRALLAKKAEVLSEAEKEVAKEYQALVLEQLAQTYIDLGEVSGEREDYQNAIACLDRITEMGWDTYVTHNNIGILCQRIGEFEQAEQEYTSMLKLYGEDYRTYKRLAFLEIDRQAEKENRSRDYQSFLSYYQKAKALFADSGARSDSDMELQLLDQAYEQLREGNWLE